MASQYASKQPSGYENRISRVAIIGAGGRMGSFILEHLLKAGTFEITAIQRPESTNRIGATGIKVVRADYAADEDDATLEALRGQHALIITMSVSGYANVGKLIRAASTAGVPWILPNWFGNDPLNDKLMEDCGFSAMRDSVIDSIRTLGVSSYFLLACNFWYEFSLGGGPNRYGFDFKTKELVWFDEGDVKINHSTWPQCGRAVAKLLSLKILPDDESDKSLTLSHFRNKPVYISSFLASQKDMFTSVKRVTGTTDKDWKFKYESAQQRWDDAVTMTKLGDRSAYVRRLYSKNFVPGAGGDYESSRGLHNELLSLPQEDIDEWTREAIRIGQSGEVAY